MDEFNFEPKDNPPVESEESNEQTIVHPRAAKSFTAEGDLRMDKSAALVVRSAKNMTITDSAVLAGVAGGDMQVNYSFGQTVVAGRDISLDNSLLLSAVVGRDVDATGSVLGIVFAKKLELAGGSRILFNTPQAVAFGAALGAGLALVSWLLRKRAH